MQALIIHAEKTVADFEDACKCRERLTTTVFSRMRKLQSDSVSSPRTFFVVLEFEIFLNLVFLNLAFLNLEILRLPLLTPQTPSARR